MHRLLELINSDEVRLLVPFTFVIYGKRERERESEADKLHKQKRTSSEPSNINIYISTRLAR